MEQIPHGSYIDIYIDDKLVTRRRHPLSFSNKITGLIEKGFWYSYDITVHPPHSLYREHPLQKKLSQEELDKIPMAAMIQLFSTEENLDFVPNDGEDHENK